MKRAMAAVLMVAALLAPSSAHALSVDCSVQHGKWAGPKCI